MKRCWWVMAIAWLVNLAFIVGVSLYGADITGGHSFVSGETVTATKLNNLGAGTINGSFFTGKTAATNPAAATTFFLYYDTVAATYYKIALQWLLDHDRLINARTDLASGIATNDYFLVFDTSVATLKKVNLSDMLYGSNGTNLWATAADLPMPPVNDAELLLLQSNLVQKVDVGMLMTNLPSRPGWTNNLVTHTELTNDDVVVVWSAVGGSNRFVTVAGLITNLVDTSANNTDMIPIYSPTANAVKSITVQDLGTYMSLNLGLLKRFSGASNAIPGAGGIITNAHGLTGIPVSFGCLLVCTNDQYGYLAGERINAAFSDQAAGTPAMAVSADAVNVYIVYSGDPIYVTRKDSLANGALTDVNWNLVAWAIGL